MREQPTNSEIGRRIDELSLNVRDGFDRMNLRLDRYVLAEVHSMQVGQTDRRITELEAELDAIKADRSIATRYVITTILATLGFIGSLTLGVIAAV